MSREVYKRGLSKVQRKHLTELIETALHRPVAAECYWQPGTAGEWAVARALERRGLIQRNVNRGQRAYTLSLNKEMTDLAYDAAVQAVFEALTL